MDDKYIVTINYLRGSLQPGSVTINLYKYLFDNVRKRQLNGLLRRVVSMDYENRENVRETIIDTLKDLIDNAYMKSDINRYTGLLEMVKAFSF